MSHSGIASFRTYQQLVSAVRHLPLGTVDLDLVASFLGAREVDLAVVLGL